MEEDELVWTVDWPQSNSIAISLDYGLRFVQLTACSFLTNGKQMIWASPQTNQ